MERETDSAPIELSSQVSDTRYFSFSDPGLGSRVPVQIIFGGLEHCDKDYRIERAEFPVFLLEFVLEGSGSLTLGNERHDLRKGCLYWYGPGIPCHLVNNPEDPLTKYFMAFRCPDGSLGEIYNLSRQFIGANRGGDQVQDLVEQLFKEAWIGNEVSCRICCSYLDVILLKCARNQILEQYANERAWHVFKRIKDFISDNYLELKRMEEIADEMDMNVSYISRLFKRYYHMTPYNFLIQKKMEYALDLLRHGNCNVQKTAELAGFENPFHFSRVFKKFKGINPSEVREVSS